MAKAKEKEKELPKKNNKVGELVTTTDEPSQAASEALSRREFWKEEILALQGQTFEDLEQALNCVIDKAVLRISPKDGSAEQLKAFLMTVMQSDQGILDTLKSTLRIKNS